MKALFPPLSRLLPFLVAAALLSPAVHAGNRDNDNDDQEGATARVKFSDPAKPGTLKFSMPWADVHITGTDGKEIIVTSSLDQKGKSEVDHEGFRNLIEEVTFEVVEKDNVAVIVLAGENAWAAHGAEFDIKVPRNTNLAIRTEAGGDIVVEGVEGDLDVNSMNGEIELEGISSSAVVNTLNGEIRATFKHAPTKPVSLSSMNGEIDLRLPSDTKANLRMRTNNGTIRTNFSAAALQTKTEKSFRSGDSRAPEARVDGDGRSTGAGDVDREIAREMARADREQAKIARDVAKEIAKANAEVARVASQVRVNVNGEDVVVAVPPIPPVPPMPNFGGKSIVGTLNGGGIDIKLTSMNGTITLRESK
ncbi:MAG TPA: DUF4097 family beta strand repeat-containing protein [Lacunisphaera sp.]|nr:DUF4097 family beta strand repeat-containing protein [Lacunisphaera sp.]